MSTIDPNTYQNLKAPLPDKAVRPHPTKGYLSTINPGYVIDRLNEVFGLGGWMIDYEIISVEEKMVVAKGTLEVPDTGIKVVQFGGNDNADKGDAYKGACTDALTKCASYIGVGLHVWMDDKRPETLQHRAGSRQNSQQSPQGGGYPSGDGRQASPKAIAFLRDLATRDLVPDNDRHRIEQFAASGLLADDCSRLIDNIKAFLGGHRETIFNDTTPQQSAPQSVAPDDDGLPF